MRMARGLGRRWMMGERGSLSVMATTPPGLSTRFISARMSLVAAEGSSCAMKVSMATSWLSLPSPVSSALACVYEMPCGRCLSLHAMPPRTVRQEYGG